MADVKKYLIIVVVAALLAVVFAPAAQSEGSETNEGIRIYDNTEDDSGANWNYQKPNLYLHDGLNVDFITFPNVKNDSNAVIDHVTIFVDGVCNVGTGGINAPIVKKLTIEGDALIVKGQINVHGSLIIDGLKQFVSSSATDDSIIEAESISINNCDNMEIDMGKIEKRICFSISFFKNFDAKLAIVNSCLNIKNIGDGAIFAQGPPGFFDGDASGLTPKAGGKDVDQKEANQFFFGTGGSFVYDSTTHESGLNMYTVSLIAVGVVALLMLIVGSIYARKH